MSFQSEVFAPWNALVADSLTVTSVPEPATWLAGALLVEMVGRTLRRRLARAV